MGKLALAIYILRLGNLSIFLVNEVVPRDFCLLANLKHITFYTSCYTLSTLPVIQLSQFMLLIQCRCLIKHATTAIEVSCVEVKSTNIQGWNSFRHKLLNQRMASLNYLLWLTNAKPAAPEERAKTRLVRTQKDFHCPFPETAKSRSTVSIRSMSIVSTYKVVATNVPLFHSAVLLLFILLK